MKALRNLLLAGAALAPLAPLGAEAQVGADAWPSGADCGLRLLRATPPDAPAVPRPHEL